MVPKEIIHPDFVPDRPIWWDGFAPRDDLRDDPSGRTDVAIVGGGYTGLSAAITLAQAGISVAVLEAGAFGAGASTRNGGGVGGAVTVGKTLGGRRLPALEAERAAILDEASRAFAGIEALIAAEGIACDWQQNGRFLGAWTPAHFRAQAASLSLLNDHGRLGARMILRMRQREELATDLYHGGMVLERTASVHPARLYGGLLNCALSAGVLLCSDTRAMVLTRRGTGWTISTNRGPLRVEQVVIATNGYTDHAAPELRRRLVPLASNIIVTEELPEGLAEALFPTNRYVNDSPRIRSYYRLTPDRKRVLFGGRGRFRRGTFAGELHRKMVERLPDLRGIRITHAWSGQVAFTLDSIPHVGARDGLHFALGCNGSGIAMMTHLGRYLGRRIAGSDEPASLFDRPLPGHPLYTGDPWFLPFLGRYFEIRDGLDRRRARA